MISITTQTYDLSGELVIYPDKQGTDLKSNRRRVSRTATLDGGCSITDQGFSDSDRTLVVQKREVDQTTADSAWYIFKNYSLVNIAVGDGYFSAAIQDVSIKEGNLRMIILIKESA